MFFLRVIAVQAVSEAAQQGYYNTENIARLEIFFNTVAKIDIMK